MSAIVACEQQKISDIEHIARADQSYQAGDLSAAIIHLKNALQTNPNNVDARLRIGKLYLELKDGVSAEKELRRAKKLGSRDVDINLHLLYAMRIQNKFDEILERYNFTLKDVNESNAAEVAIVSEALLATGDFSSGESLLNQAYGLAPNITETKIVKIKFNLAKSDIKKAESMLREFINEFPDHEEAKLIQGNLFFSQQRFQESAGIFQKVIEQNRKNIMSLPLFSAYIGAIRSELSMKEWISSKKLIDELSRRATKHPIPKYFDAVLNYEQKNYETSKEKLFLVLKELPDHLPSHLLLGTILYIEKSYEQAGGYLASYVNRVPTHTHAVKLLAAIKLRQNRPSEAVDLLMPVTSGDKVDGKIFAMIGQSAIASGDLRLGGKYLRKAAKTDEVNKVAIRSELAKIYLAQGDEVGAFEELQKLAKSHPKQSLFMQASLYTKKKDFKKAKKIAESLKKDFPTDPAVELLLAQINITQENFLRARKHFLNALELKQEFLPALLGVARLDLSNGDLLKAKHTFENILEIDPINDISMMGLAQISEANGDLDLSIEWLEKARKNGRNSLIPHILLARYYFNNNKSKLAIKISEDVVKKYPNNQRALELLAFSYLKQKNADQAVKALQEIVEQQPKNTGALVKLASVQVLNKQLVEARASLKRVLKLEEKHVSAQVGLFNIELQQGNNDRAKKVAEDLISQNKKGSIGYVLLGDLKMREKDYTEAEHAYERAFSNGQTAQIAIKYSSAIGINGDKKRALKPLRQWVEKNPNDMKTRVVLGTAYQSANQTDKGISELEKVLAIQPNNSVVLNNLSWMYFEKKDSRSVVYAEKAYEISPNVGAITDTLGWLLVQNSQLKRGVPLLEKAVQQSKRHPEIMYHLAVAYYKQGKNVKSLNILKEILDKDVDGDIKKNAEALMIELKS